MTYSERVCGCLRRLRRGLQKLEIRDYALKSAGGLSEAKASCPLLISVLSIVPDFLVFAATELGAEATRTHALKGFRKGASLFSGFTQAGGTQKTADLFGAPFAADGDMVTVTWSNLLERLKGMGCGVNFKANRPL